MGLKGATWQRWLLGLAVGAAFTFGCGLVAAYLGFFEVPNGVIKFAVPAVIVWTAATIAERIAHR